MAAAKAYATDNVPPILTKHPRSLGAPFEANWNDHLTAEEGIFVWYAFLVRVFGLFLGSNLALLAAHVLSAEAFFLVARRLGANGIFSASLGLLFSMSHFAFARNLQHLVLTYYWHVPLGCLVVWWCLDPNKYRWSSQKHLACLGIAVLHAVQFPYYTGMFLQFLFLVAFILLIQKREWRVILLPVGLGALTLAIFVLMNIDTIFNRLMHGPNSSVLARSYVGIELYALKPIDLLIPATHRWSGFETWANNAYFTQAYFIGEGGSPYLGVISIVAICWLSWYTIKRLATGERTLIPRHVWFLLWILFFSVVGGLNGLLGTFGIVVFRGTNRYSIVIMAIALLFLAKELTQRCRRRRTITIAAVATLIAFVGLWDQLPRFTTKDQIAQTHAIIISDQFLVTTMEANLPHGSMIFEMPVLDYPEVPPIYRMLDYEPFRPYLQSRFLRFSYGSDKGRPRERWQRETEQLPPVDLARVLEQYGFSAILINRKGYADQGAGIVEGLRTAGRKVLVESGDYICMVLVPSLRPTLPPTFDDHWYGSEGSFDANWRWSEGSATITLYNGSATSKTVEVRFGLAGLRPQHITVNTMSAPLYSSSIDPDKPPRAVALKINMAPGATLLRFETDQPGQMPDNGDLRKLAFSVKNFSVVE